jgi:glycosyltransferase involved in cell wall biosynthesis
MPRLSILHCLRAPVGGLFRHVRDLVVEQAVAGHEIGVVCEANARDPLTAPRLEALRPHLALGLHLVPMARQISLRDFTAYNAVCTLVRETGADIVHGHGAKGGAYARLAAHRLKSAGLGVSGIYTPHGGSLHYSPRSPQGLLFKHLERALCRRSDAIIFESRFSQTRFEERIGRPQCISAVIPNGLGDEDFVLHEPMADAVDVLYVGEMRDLKGVDVLIEALAALMERRDIRAMLVGDGPDRQSYVDMVAERGLAERITLPGAMPAREAFARGRCIVVPSRAESFPYIVLEAGAAALPMIATNVGGIPEIVEGTSTKLIAPDSPRELAQSIAACLDDPGSAAVRAASLRSAIRERFTVSRMAQDIQALYDKTRRTRSSRVADNVMAINHG